MCRGGESDRMSARAEEPIPGHAVAPCRSQPSCRYTRRNAATPREPIPGHADAPRRSQPSCPHARGGAAVTEEPVSGRAVAPRRSRPSCTFGKLWPDSCTRQRHRAGPNVPGSLSRLRWCPAKPLRVALLQAFALTHQIVRPKSQAGLERVPPDLPLAGGMPPPAEIAQLPGSGGVGGVRETPARPPAPPRNPCPSWGFALIDRAPEK